VEKAYGADGVKARASEYARAIIRAKNSEAFPDGNFEISSGTLASEMDNLTQGGLARGDMDGLDWARDEIFAETFAQASQSMDFSAIRRGAPAGGNVLTFAEGILGAQSRALSASGVRIDPQTGAPLDTPDALFKENPLLATDKNLINQLGTYINNYRQWANDPTHEKPRPNRIAPSGRERLHQLRGIARGHDARPRARAEARFVNKALFNGTWLRLDRRLWLD
jgi:hypothetical protein